MLFMKFSVPSIFAHHGETCAVNRVAAPTEKNSVRGGMVASKGKEYGAKRRNGKSFTLSFN